MGKFSVFKVLAAITLAAQMGVAAQTGISLLSENRVWIDKQLGSGFDDGHGSYSVLTRMPNAVSFKLFQAAPNPENEIWTWSNVGIGVLDDWSQVTSVKITYKANNPISIGLWDPGYGGYNVRLPAAPNGTTRIINWNDFELEALDWQSADRPPLSDRLRAISAFAISSAFPDEYNWNQRPLSAIETNMEITELTVYGLIDGTGNEGINLAQNINGWKSGNVQTSISGENGNLEFTLSGTDGYIDFDFSGDWSRFRGFSMDMRNLSAPIIFEIKNRNGKVFDWHHSSDADYDGNLSLGYFDNDWRTGNASKAVSAIPARGMSVLNANITGIRIVPATPGATVSGTIKSFILKGIDNEEIDVIWGAQNEFVFNGAAQAPTATARTRSGAPLALTVSGAQIVPGAGYTATAALSASNSAFNLKGATKSFSITKAPLSPVLNIQNATVNKGENLTLNVVGNLGGATPVFEYSANRNGEFSTTAPTEIGTYFVRARIPETPNFLSAQTAPAEFAIVSPGAQTVVVNWGQTNTFAFDGTLKAPTAWVQRSISPNSLEMRTVPLIVTGAINQGTHTATARLEYPDENFVLSNTTRDFTITRRPLSPTMVSPVSSVRWTGAPITPTVTLRDGNRVLAQGIDYTVSAHENNTEVGMARIKITGAGNYSGEISADFEIISAAMGITLGFVTWSAQSNFVFNGQAQGPTAVIKDLWGNSYDVIIEGKQTNAGTYIAMARVNSANHPGQFFVLDVPMTPYTIAPKPLTVSWTNPREFTFNRMVQVPLPSVTEQGVNLFVVNPQSRVGDYTGALAAVAEISSANRGNYTLASNTVDYKITRRELTITLPDGEEFENGAIITIPENIVEKEDFVRQLLTVEGFANDTTGIVDRNDNESVLNITLTEISPSASPSLRSSGRSYKVVISADNYRIAGEGDPTSIRNVQISDNRYGITLESPIVSDMARITVRLPEPAQITLRIFDNLGNTVHTVETQCLRLESATPCETVWNLTNNAGRYVANGTYLIVAEATGISGKTYRYQTRIGVKR